MSFCGTSAPLIQNYRKADQDAMRRASVHDATSVLTLAQIQSSLHHHLKGIYIYPEGVARSLWRNHRVYRTRHSVKISWNELLLHTAEWNQKNIDALLHKMFPHTTDFIIVGLAATLSCHCHRYVRSWPSRLICTRTDISPRGARIVFNSWVCVLASTRDY